MDVHVVGRPEPCILPMDVIYEIISQFTTPRSQDAYCYEPDVVPALCSLCLVNRDVHHLAQRYLYDRMFLTSPVQVTRIVKQGIPSGAVVRSIWLDERATWELDSVASLLILLAPTLERLSMDRPNIVLVMPLIHSGSVGWYQGPNFTNMPVLRELGLLCFLGSTFPQPLSQISDSYPCLSRLIVQAGEPPLFEYIETLEALVIVSRWTFPGTVEQIIQKNPRLRQVIRIVAPWTRKSLNAKDLITEQVRIAIEYRDRVTIRDVHPEVDQKAFELWVADHVRHGTIWRLEGNDWATLCP